MNNISFVTAKDEKIQFHLIDGKIAKSGGEELAEALEEKGYGWLDS